MTEPNPAVPVGYPLDLSPLLEAILQMRDSQLEFQRVMLENGSTSSRMHMAVEDAPLPPPPALPHVAMPSTGPSMPSEAPEVLHPGPSLPLLSSHISCITSPVASRSAFATPDVRWELGSDIQAAMVKSVGMMVTKLRIPRPAPSSRCGCLQWRTGWRATWGPHWRRSAPTQSGR